MSECVFVVEAGYRPVCEKCEWACDRAFRSIEAAVAEGERFCASRNGVLLTDDELFLVREALAYVSADPEHGIPLPEGYSIADVAALDGRLEALGHERAVEAATALLEAADAHDGEGDDG